MVWPLTLKNPGLWHRGMVTGRPGEKPERWHLSSIKTSHYWWRTDAGVKIVTFRIAANTIARNGSGWIQLFNIWRPSQEKKNWICPLHFATPPIPHHRICGNPEGNNFKAGICGPSIRGSFDGRRTPTFRFLTWSLADWVKNLNADICRPSKLPLIDRQWTLVNCCLPDRYNYDGVEQKGSNLVFFSWQRTSDIDVKKKIWIRSLPVSTIVFAAIGKEPILTPASVVHQ